MKAITFHGVGDVRVQDVAEPKVVDPTPSGSACRSPTISASACRPR